MLDRVREAMFSTLAPWLPGANVLDLFAGTGSLGLEALSRGAERARLVEQGAHVHSILRRNVQELGLDESVHLVTDDALDPRSWGSAHAFDIVFLDPPYPFLKDGELRARVLETVRTIVLETLAPEGVAVLHVPKRALRVEEFSSDLSTARRQYGTNALWYFQVADSEEHEAADEDSRER